MPEASGLANSNQRHNSHTCGPSNALGEPNIWSPITNQQPEQPPTGAVAPTGAGTQNLAKTKAAAGAAGAPTGAAQDANAKLEALVKEHPVLLEQYQDLAHKFGRK